MELNINYGYQVWSLVNKTDREVTYSLKDDGELTIHYSAISDKACPFNITNHAFFNLNSTGSIKDHVLLLPSNHYIDV